MSKANRHPIGLFDSGVGGLSVVEEVHRHLPFESLIYCADSANAPYGSKSAEFIRERVIAIADYLLDRNVKTIVIACNTATAAAAEILRGHVEIPVIAMEPAVKPGTELTQSGLVGVLATEHMLQSNRYRQLISQYGGDVEVIAQPCPGLVEAVEEGRVNSIDTETLLNQYLQPLLEKRIDTLVLGCTHYPFLRGTIEKILAGRKITIVDTGEAVARQVGNQLARSGWLNQDKPSRPFELLTTGDPRKANAFVQSHKTLTQLFSETTFRSILV